jgi:hypothetical protein
MQAQSQYIWKKGGEDLQTMELALPYSVLERNSPSIRPFGFFPMPESRTQLQQLVLVYCHGFATGKRQTNHYPLPRICRSTFVPLHASACQCMQTSRVADLEAISRIIARQGNPTQNVHTFLYPRYIKPLIMTTTLLYAGGKAMGHLTSS